MAQEMNSKPSQSVLQKLVSDIWTEIDITSRLIESKASFAFGLYLCGFIPRALPLLSVSASGSLLPTVLFLAFANVYGFDICNQATSADEDALNRPGRPFPAGLLTVEGAYRRWVISWIGTPAVLLAMGLPVAAWYIVLYNAWTCFCYTWPKPKFWVWKNLYTPVALFCSLRALNGVMTARIPDSDMNIWMDAGFALWLFLTIHVRDFHDVEGDRQSGRRTLPIILSGSQITLLRRATAVVLVSAAAALVLVGVNLCQDRYDIWIAIFASLQVLGGTATASHFAQTSTKQEGEDTFKLFHIPTALVIIIYLCLVNNAM